MGFYGSGGGSFEWSVNEIDCSAASPTFRSLARTVHSTSNLFPSFFSTDQYGQKSPFQLTAGQSNYSIANGNQPFMLAAQGVGLRAAPRLFLSQESNVSCISGAANESFISAIIDGSSVGFTIQRIEAAA